MSTDKRGQGRVVEEAACAYLQRAGLALLARNVDCRYGEIDLVMRDGEQVVFTEVRFRAGTSRGGAAASVDRRKQGRVAAAARWYLAGRRELASAPCRFDVLAVSGAPPYEFAWLRDAFRPDD